MPPCPWLPVMKLFFSVPALAQASLSALAAFTLLTSPLPGLAAVNDIFPGDYFPPKPGSTTASVYLFEREQRGPYAHGKRQFPGQLDSQMLALRLVQTGTLGGRTTSAIAVLPWSDSQLQPAPLAAALGKEARGLADVRLGLSTWLINAPEQAHYLALTAMVTAPTGRYQPQQLLNTGENRWKYVLMAGWQKDITPRLLVELAPELAFYGDNDDYQGRRLEQKHSWALTGYLRYRVTPAWHLHLGGQLNRGGATRINGVDQHNAPDNHRVTGGMTWFLPEQQQVILRFGRETRAEHGFRIQNEVALRYQIAF